MAPAKSTKRSLQCAQAEPTEKKPRRDPAIVAVADALAQAEGLSEKCREMLTAGLQSSLSTPSDERHSLQQLFVRMIGEALEAVEAKLQERLEAASAHSETCARSKAELEKRLAGSEAAMVTAVEAAEAKKAVLTEVAGKMVAAKTALSEKQDAQRSGDLALECTEQQKASIDECIETKVKAIMDGCWDAEQGNPCKSLQPILDNLDLDESLMTALPAVCMKGPTSRGAFDNMVLLQLDESLKEKAGELGRTLQEGAPARAERKAAVEAAQAELTAVVDLQARATDEMSAAMTGQKAADVALSSAKDALAGYEPEFRAAAEARDKMKEALEMFIAHNKSCFETLRDAVARRPAEVMPAKEAPVGEQSTPALKLVGGA